MENIGLPCTHMRTHTHARLARPGGSAWIRGLMGNDGLVFGHFLDNFWGYFGDHLGTRSAQEGAKMGTKGPPRASKTQNPAFANTLKNHWLFKVFGVKRPPKRGS